jgi:hypothetical protein
VSAAVVGANEAAMDIQECSRVAAPQPIREERFIPRKRLTKIALKKLFFSSIVGEHRKISSILPFGQPYGASFPDFRAVQEAPIIRTKHNNRSRRRHRQG